MKKFKFNKKQIAIIGVVALIVVIIVAIIFHMCKPGKANAANIEQESQESRVDKVDDVEVDKPTQDIEARDSETSEEKTDKEKEPLGEFKFVENESGDKYDEFLAGKGTISFSYYRKNVLGIKEECSVDEDELIELLPKQDFTLEQFVETLDNVFAAHDELNLDYKVESVSYSFIDCGMDGKREMVLLVGSLFWGPSDIEFVIKDIDNQLQVIYAGVSAGRQFFDVNKNGGILREGGPYPPTMHTHDEYLYIDKTGKVKSIYTIEADSGMSSFAFSVMDKSFGEEEELRNKYSKIDDEITPYKLSYEGKEYYSYEVSYKNSSSNIYKDSEYQKAMDESFDCKFISIDEFNKIKKKRLESVGASEEVIGNEKFDEFETVDYTKIYEGKSK